MKKLIIKSMEINTWKAIEYLKIEFEQLLKISGDNETGKSSIGSAITWVLNGTDIDGNILEDVIPVGAVEGTSPRVCLEMRIIDEKGIERPLTIEKTYKAKQDRKKVYTGEYVIEYMLNGAKAIKKDVVEYINKNICDDELFNMLSNVMVFTETIKTKGKESQWQVQRRIITSLLPDIKDDAEITQTNESYVDLKEGVLRHGTVSAYLKQLSQEKSILEGYISEFPARLETLSEQLDEIEVKKTEDEVLELIREAEVEATNLKAENTESRESQIKEFYDQKEVAKEAIKTKVKELKEAYEKELTAFTESKNKIVLEQSKLQNEYSGFKQRYDENEKRITALERKEVQTNCETCGAKLDEEKTKHYLSEKEKILNELISNKETLKDFLNAIVSKNNELKKQREELVEPKKPEGLEESEAEIKAIDQRQMEVHDLENYQENMQELTNKQAELNLELSKIRNANDLEVKIQDLTENNTLNMQLFGENQRLIDLCKDFTKEKCSDIEAKANDLFANTGITFSLFKDVKATGEEKEAFSILFNGKRYNGELSLSTKKLVSYWITLALQKAYNIQVPIILDNMESTGFNTDSLDHQLILITRTIENCPKCNVNDSRRALDGSWTCKSCGNTWKKNLIVE